MKTEENKTVTAVYYNTDKAFPSTEVISVQSDTQTFKKIAQEVEKTDDKLENSIAKVSIIL